MENRAVVQLRIPKSGVERDLDVPLAITASELLEGLNSAYDLGLDVGDGLQCYVKAENPIVLLHGHRTLGEFGIRHGSIINVTE